MNKVAIHQPGFIPWYPFFYKMAMADMFVILCHVNFEKNNFQNRYYLNDKQKWVTKPVSHGTEWIVNKSYADGSDLMTINMSWINAIKDTLGIKTRLVFDFPTENNKTERLVELLKTYNATHYITCKSAKGKYLDEELIKSSGIEIEYMSCPPHLQKHTFEIFDRYGIDGAIKNLPKKEIK